MTVTLADTIIGLITFVVGFIVAPAFAHATENATGLRKSLGLIHAEMDSDVDPIRRRIAFRRRRKQQRNTAQAGSDDSRIPIVVGAVIIVGLYLRYQVAVMFAMAVAAMFISLLVSFVLVRMSRQGVVTGGTSNALIFLLLFAVTALGAVDIWLLLNPPAGGELYREFMTTYRQEGRFASLEGWLMILYQVVGVGTYLLVTLISIGFCLAVLAALYRNVNAWGTPVWRYLFVGTSAFWRPGFAVFAVLAAAFSILLCGGYLFEWAITAQNA